MIVFVKINVTYKPGINPVLAAWRAWHLDGLLSDSTLRNSAKHLVAVYKTAVIASYGINAIAADAIDRNRVCFALTETDKDCFEKLNRTYVNFFKKTASSRMPCGYIDSEIICSCNQSEIPIVETKLIKEGRLI